MIIDIKYGSRAVKNNHEVSIEDKFLDVSFRSKVKHAIDENAAGLSIKQIPRAGRGGILSAAVTFVLAAGGAVVMWAPLPRAYLMVSFVTGLANWLTATGVGSHPHG
jgi:hypothetical protein